MKIAFFSDTFLPQVNGVATSLANFARELGEQGHEVLIVTPRVKVEGPAFTAKNVEVVHLPSLPALVYPTFRMSPVMGFPRAYAAVKAFDPDVIHFHTTLSVCMDALLIARMLKKPLVGTYHIYLTPRNNEYLSFIAPNPFFRKFATSLVLNVSLPFYRACDIALAPSHLLCDELRACNVRPDFHYLPNAVPDFSVHTPSDEERKRLKEKYGLKKNVILHIGRLSAEKCVDDVVRSFALVCKQLPDSTLLIVGEGPHRAALESLVAEFGLQDNVHFTGFLPPSELFASGLPAVADVFATASTMESQGMVVVEAMTVGLPVVAARGGAVPEVLGNAGLLGEKGDLQAMADALIKILSDDVLRKDQQRLSLERRREFTIGNVTRRLVAYYEEAIRMRTTESVHAISR